MRRATLTGTPGATELNAAKDRLTSASHKLAEAMYKASSTGSGSGAPTDGDAAAAGTTDETKKDEGVIDAEYVDTK